MVLQQRMYSENFVHVILWYVLCLFLSNAKHDKHIIRIKLKYDYRYSILLDKLRNRMIAFLF